MVRHRGPATGGRHWAPSRPSPRRRASWPRAPRRGFTRRPLSPTSHKPTPPDRLRLDSGARAALHWQMSQGDDARRMAFEGRHEHQYIEEPTRIVIFIIFVIFVAR